LARLVEEAHAPRLRRQQDIAGAQALGVVGPQPAQQHPVRAGEPDLAGRRRAGTLRADPHRQRMNLAAIPPELWASLWLTVRLAATSTAILLLAGLPLAGWLNRSRSATAPLVEALVTLPIVLPPTVIGFYVLLALGSRSPIGQAWASLFGSSLAFS